MSTDLNDDAPNRATTFLWGIKSALCCCTPDNITAPVVPRKNQEEPSETQSRSLINVPLSTMIVSRPKLGAEQGPVDEHKSEENIITQRNNDNLLAPGNMSAVHKPKNSSEIWSPNKRQSDWDMFFESQSDLLAAIRGSVANTTDGSIASWEATDSETPHEIYKMTTEQGGCALDYSRSEGNVFLSYMSKGGMRYTSVSPDTRVEMVAAWLNQGSCHNLPISENIHPDGAATQGKFRKLTLSEAFGDRLDSETQGITIFVGPVNGRMCYQLSICDLEMLRRATRHSVIFMGELKKPIEFIS